MSDETLAFQAAILKKVNELAAGTEVAEVTAGEAIEDSSFVGIVGDKCYNIDKFPLIADTGASSYGGRRAFKCESLTDHYIALYGAATSLLAIMYKKDSTTGILEEVGSQRTIAATCGTLEDHAIYDAVLVDGSDGYEYLAVIYKDSSNYMSGTAIKIESTGLGTPGTAQQKTITISAVGDSVRIKKVNSTVVCITVEDDNAATSETFLANINTMNSQLSYATAETTLDHSVFIYETSDNELIFKREDHVNWYVYTYNASTLAMDTQVDTTAGTAIENIIGGGLLSTGEYYVIGRTAGGLLIIELMDYDQDTNTLTAGDTFTEPQDMWTFEDTDGSVHEVADDPDWYYTFLMNDVVVVQDFASWTESGTTAIDALHFSAWRFDNTGFCKMTSVNYGSDPNCSTLDTDIAVDAFISPVNPAWGILCTATTSYIILAPVLFCENIGYVVTGGAVAATLDVYIKGYVTSSYDKNIITYGNGLIHETNREDNWAGSINEQLLYHLGYGALGRSPKKLVKSIGSKIYLTGEGAY